MKMLLRLLGLFKPYIGWMLLGILASALTLFANVALMAISGWFIASMAMAGAAGISMNYFTPAAMIRAAAIVRTGGRYVERLVTHEATFRLLAKLRVWFYRHLEPHAPAGLENYRSGDLLSRIRADIDTLDNLYVRVIVPVFVALIGGVLLTLVAAAYDQQLALILLLTLLLAGVVLPLWTARLGRRPGKQVVELSATLRTAVVDGVQGMAELTVCGAEEESARQTNMASKQLIRAQEKMSRIAGLSQTGLLLSANLALWAIMLSAIPLVESGTINPQDLAMLALFTLAAFESVMPLPEAFSLLGQTTIAAKRLFDIVDRKLLVQEPDTASPAPEQFHWQFDSVGFRYAEDEPMVLQDITLDLPPGKRMAVAGSTGSGKSTLIHLLLKYRAPNTGQISLSGNDLSTYKGEDLRDWIAVVPQQVYLFNTTIRDNLNLANPDAKQETLESACRIAQIHDFIVSQPDGYDTWVGETGVKLSGGQARRIAIARALLRDFHLLVLDEPGEGLDLATQQALMEALFGYLEDRSLLMITHQPTGLKKLDEVVVIDSGKIIERGSYAGLRIASEQFAESIIYKE